MANSEQEGMRISSATVRRLRTGRGWSQEQLAAAAGLSLRTIQRVESDGSASRETRTSLAATFGIPLVDLGLEATVPRQSASRSNALPARYKVCAVIAGVSFCIVLLGIAGLLPERSAWAATPSAMLAIALVIYAGFGWYFSGDGSVQSYPRRMVQTFFIFVAVFCAFALLRGDDSGTDVFRAAHIGVLSMAIYVPLDYLFSRRRRSAGDA